MAARKQASRQEMLALCQAGVPQEQPCPRNIHARNDRKLPSLANPHRPCNFLVRNRRDDVPHLK